MCFHTLFWVSSRKKSKWRGSLTRELLQGLLQVSALTIYIVRWGKCPPPTTHTHTHTQMKFYCYLHLQIVTAKTMATLLSTVPLAARGPAQIFIFDIHALQERFYFSEMVIPRYECVLTVCSCICTVIVIELVTSHRNSTVHIILYNCNQYKTSYVCACTG